MSQETRQFVWRLYAERYGTRVPLYLGALHTGDATQAFTRSRRRSSLVQSLWNAVVEKQMVQRVSART